MWLCHSPTRSTDNIKMFEITQNAKDSVTCEGKQVEMSSLGHAITRRDCVSDDVAFWEWILMETVADDGVFQKWGGPKWGQTMACASSPFKHSQAAGFHPAWGEFTCSELDCPTFWRWVLLQVTVVNRRHVSGTKTCLAPDAAKLIPKLDNTEGLMHCHLKVKLLVFYAFNKKLIENVQKNVWNMKVLTIFPSYLKESKRLENCKTDWKHFWLELRLGQNLTCHVSVLFD